MQKMEQYLKFAADCRELARIAIPTNRPLLIKMAEAWEHIADERSRQRSPRAVNDREFEI
jgi:hypothetical protein